MLDPLFAAVRHEGPTRCAHDSFADARSSAGPSGIEAGDLGQLLEQLPVPLRQPGRHHDPDLGVEVAGGTARVRHTPPAQPQPPPGRRTRGYLDLDLAAR